MKESRDFQGRSCFVVETKAIVRTIPKLASDDKEEEEPRLGISPTHAQRNASELSSVGFCFLTSLESVLSQQRCVSITSA